jgi:hypothetical protein
MKALFPINVRNRCLFQAINQTFAKIEAGIGSLKHEAGNM